MQSDRQQRVSERAFHIWLAEGRVDGRDHEHWRRAEREIAAEEARVASALANRATKTTRARRAPQTKPAGAAKTTRARPGRRPPTKAPSR